MIAKMGGAHTRRASGPRARWARRGRGIATVLALMLASPLARAKPPKPRAAPAAPKPLSDTLTGEAKADYEAGKLLFGDGDYAGAEIKLQSAYDKSQDARLLWNVAACEKQQRHYAKTIALVRRYLDTGGTLLTDQDRAEAKALLDAIESFTVKLTIVTEPGAEISIDDEVVGTAPLAQPVVVDLGNRKITVKKAGFKDSVKDVPVGGSAEAKIEVKLEAEVHLGHLVVTSQKDAAISIDGAPVGTGRFEGDLKSGGHTLRVEAKDMVPYQSEVVLADDEKRSIDVPLQHVYIPPPQKPIEPPGPNLELGLSLGPGVKMHGDKPWMMIERVDVGYRAGWPTDLAFFLEAAEINASGTCGTNLHGATASSPTDLSTRYSFDSCQHARAGFWFGFHLLPAHVVDPWLGVEPAFRLTKYSYRSFDAFASPPLGSATHVSPAIDAGLRAGVDIHPIRSFKPLGIGVYGALIFAIIADEDVDKHDSNGQTTSPFNNNNDGSGPAFYTSLAFGARGSLQF